MKVGSRWKKIVDVDVDVVERKSEEGWKVDIFRKARATLAARVWGACDLDTNVNEGSVSLGKARWCMCCGR